MRVMGGALLGLWALYAGACADPGAAPADLEAAPADLRPAALGTEVLIYYGSGGIPPLALPSKQFSYARLSAALPGHRVSHTGSWPPSLDPFSLIVLVFPGASTSGQGLDAGQQGQVAAWVDRGGRLVIQSDWGWGYDRYLTSLANRAASDLMGRLGARVVVEGNHRLLSKVALRASDPLNSGGVLALTCDDPTMLNATLGGALRRVDASDLVTIVALTRGRGEVVFLGDGACLDDSRPRGLEFDAFAQNLIRPAVPAM